METLRRLGLDITGHPITHLRVFAGTYTAEAPLPHVGHGLSRHAMDTALIAQAIASGAGIERGVTIRHIDTVRTQSSALFLATGKHDVKGCERPRMAQDPALGLRIRLSPSPTVRDIIGNAIELHVFHKGYAGIELQEDGTANICLALRKSLLTDAGRDPATLLRKLAADHPYFGARMADFDARTHIDAVANVPYGWRQRQDPDGLYRLGDQCAVIPSLAGEGNGIALASGESAAQAWLAGTLPKDWQQRFAQRTARPVGLATGLWHMGEGRLGGPMLAQILRIFPALATWVAEATRIRV
jgi:flavin-dependent dehydrogenase